MIKNLVKGDQCRAINSSKGKLDDKITAPFLLLDSAHKVKVVSNQLFGVLDQLKEEIFVYTKSNSQRIHNNRGYMINNNIEGFINYKSRYKLIFNTC